MKPMTMIKAGIVGLVLLMFIHGVTGKRVDDSSNWFESTLTFCSWASILSAPVVGAVQAVSRAK